MNHDLRSSLMTGLGVFALLIAAALGVNLIALDGGARVAVSALLAVLLVGIIIAIGAVRSQRPEH